MKHLSIDIETYSDVNIKSCGLYKYADSSSFKLLLFAYSADGGPVEIVDVAQGEKIPAHIMAALQDPNVIKHAFNAAFEWYCLSKYCNHGDWFRRWQLPQWRDTMLHARYCSLPGSLAGAGAALRLPQDKQKDSIGKSLIRLFSVPQTPTKTNGGRTRTLPKHEPEKWELFKSYCKQDVVTEMEIERRLAGFPVPDDVQQQWVTDMNINLNGVMIDQQLVTNAVDMANREISEFSDQSKSITGIANPKSNTQFRNWLRGQGVEADSVTKETLSELMKTDAASVVKAAIRCKQEMSKTSNAKYETMLDTVCDDGRIRGTLQFYAATRTGRWGGRFIQPQNMPRTYIHGEALDYARELIRQHNTDGLRLTFGSVSDTLSQLIRTALVAAPGHVFVDADFSAIEARVIAWLAGEQWVIDVFNSHGKIYEATAAQMFGVPIDEIAKGKPQYELRQKGKVATLALGYGGTTNALIAMGALKGGLTEAELPEIVAKWRAANPRIVDLWQKTESAAHHALKTGTPAVVNGLTFARECDSVYGLDFLTVTLPSGRKLFYAYPYEGKNRWDRPALHYLGVNTNTKWGDQETYGGKLTENIVQAIARDCLAVKLERLTQAGYKIVFHVHDEVVIEVPERYADLKAVCDTLAEPIPWAPGLPLNADGYVSRYFKKD